MDINKWNNDVLSAQGIKHKGNAPKISRNVGDLKFAKLPDGTVVERQELIFVDGHGLIRCAHYELHFIYVYPNPSGKYRGWGLFCTCGSIAGVVGTEAYSKLASPGGKMLVCVRHTATKNNVGIGQHADGSTE